MRALNFCGLCIVGLAIAGACGGESAGADDPPGSGAGEMGTGEAGDASGPGPGGNEGAGGNGEAGAVAARGGRGGGSAGAPVGGGSVGGGGSVVGGRGSVPTGGKGNPPVTGGVPGTGGVIGTAGDDGSGGDCVPFSTSTGLDSCSLELNCDGSYTYTSCYNQRAGTWFCECSGLNGSFQSYDISGVVGLAACQTVSDICTDGNPPPIDGPEECVPLSESRASNYCEVQERCSRSLAITEDVDAVVARQRYVSCSLSTAGRMDCYCSNGLNLQVEGQDGTAACDTVLDLCENPDIDPSGPVVCTPELQSAGANSCNSMHRCSQSLEVDGNVIGVSVGIRSVNCSEVNGSALCDCYDQMNYLRFTSERSAGDIATCNHFATICPAVDDLGLNGPISCAPNNQYGDAQYCNVNIECTQAGTLGDEPIRAFGTLGGYCQPVNGVWSCTCSSGTESASVEVEADGGWAACTELIDLCPDLVDVKIGESGGIVKPPFL